MQKEKQAKILNMALKQVASKDSTYHFMEKPWYKSKTVWVNIFMVVAEMIGVFTESIPLSPQVVAGLLLLNKIVNIGLRFITTGPIARM